MACSKDAGPGDDALRNALALKLPGHVSVETFDVEVTENLGTKVEPVYAARFSAILRFSTDTFTLDKRGRDVLFLNPMRKKGDTLEVFGKTASRLYGGAWRTEVSVDGSSITNSGKPLAEFTGKTVLVRGSEEEKAFIQEEEAEAQRRTDEAADRQAEAAARRQALVDQAEERRKVAAREAEERRLAQAREIEEQRQALARADELLPGKWRWQDETSEFHSDGNWIGAPDQGDGQRGRWRIDGDTLSISKELSDGRMRTSTYKIVYISRDEVRLRAPSGQVGTGRRVQ